jgi:CRISPR/Cas system CSM-associated protein Csm3 (group 7 of RAMP superfamily)
MSEPMWSAERSRKIVERIVIEGSLVLETPAHFGGGADDGAVMGLLVDAMDGKSPLLTGASIGGALRSYLWSRERGYGEKQSDKEFGSVSMAARLFGTSRDDDRGDGDQSRVIIDDARGQAGSVVYRDGVRLDELSRTAANDALYAIQLWDAGTTFPLRFELLIVEGDDSDSLKQGLAIALRGLQDSEITLGARKRRGYGRVTVTEWRVKTYPVHSMSGLMEWLREGAQPLKPEYNVGKFEVQWVDKRRVFTLDGYFQIDGSLLIRSADDVTDMKHLTGSNGKPILSGTSVAGALRARSTKILNTLGTSTPTTQDIIEDLFGKLILEKDKKEKKAKGQKPKPKASRITVEEYPIEGGNTNWVQSRVSIDRFTGGALDKALFNEQAVLGSDEDGVHIRLHLRNPMDYEIGLLLLLLKDLWTGDLMLGGERSVGRGRLCGKFARLQYDDPQNHSQWEISAVDGGLQVGPNPEQLEVCVQALLAKLGVQS